MSSIVKARLIIYNIVVVSIVAITVFYASLLAASSDERANQENGEQALLKTDLADKYYRQGLFHYFQGNFSAALTTVARAELRLGELNETSSLFKAGLQLSLGLQSKAQQSLLAFNEKYSNVNVKQSQRAKELLLVALLSLSEQLILQGKMIQAQEVLVNISNISARYYPQYFMLSQLAYWPAEANVVELYLAEPGNLTNEPPEINDNLFSPYIQLNKGLRYIEQEQFEQAITLLKALKKSTWFTAELTFWQELFSADFFSSADPSFNNEQEIQKRQSSAINNYASLLLAQIYVQQNQFEAAFFELKTFPQHSPYGESALYLFAYSAQKSKRYTSAINLLSLLHKQYPYSHLGWQAGELMAEQVSQQQTLAQGFEAYQSLTVFYQQRLAELAQFKRSLNTSLNTSLEVAADSVWLENALQNPLLVNWYQSLADTEAEIEQVQLLQNKSRWLGETIKLNQQRKANIVASQQNIVMQASLQKLIAQRDELAKQVANVINATEAVENGFSTASLFANTDELTWLNRINQGKNNFNYIKTYNESSGLKQQVNIHDYQQRIKRIEGVLNWQLHSQIPERSWQYQQQLKTLDQLLDLVHSQQGKVSILSQTQNSLVIEIEKQLKSASAADELLTQLQFLRDEIRVKINEHVALYANNEQQILEQYLLSVKRAMATILEKMAQNDAKIEQQLLTQPMSKSVVTSHENLYKETNR